MDRGRLSSCIYTWLRARHPSSQDNRNKIDFYVSTNPFFLTFSLRLLYIHKREATTTDIQEARLALNCVASPPVSAGWVLHPQAYKSISHVVVFVIFACLQGLVLPLYLESSATNVLNHGIDGIGYDPRL